VFTPADGDATTILFDKSTGLLHSVATPLPGGRSEVRTYTDYRDVDGVLAPHGFTTEGGAFKVEMVFESVEFGGEIPEGSFDLPEKVRAMLDAADE